MKKILKFLAKFAIVLLLAFGIYKSYDFYKQNKIQRKQAKELQIDSSQKSFVIVISAHNNTTYCEKSLFSALTQHYENFRILYIDDASTDDSFTKVSLMASQSPRAEKISFIRNKEPKGTLACLYEAIHTCKDHEIVLLVDGSDFLAHENVLRKLSKVYSKPSVWMTYGNFLDYPSYRQIPVKCKQIPKNIVFNNSFRTHEINDVYLKTFYAGLFKQIRKEDLLYKEKVVNADATLAYFLPLLEMSGKHACFLNEVLYLHTKSTPPLSLERVAYIKKLPKYKRLKALPSNDQAEAQKI
jgi:glycosyltransferase involved in cell wall biosynthesis